MPHSSDFHYSFWHYGWFRRVDEAWFQVFLWVSLQSQLLNWKFLIVSRFFNDSCHENQWNNRIFPEKMKIHLILSTLTTKTDIYIQLKDQYQRKVINICYGIAWIIWEVNGTADLSLHHLYVCIGLESVPVLVMHVFIYMEWNTTT